MTSPSNYPDATDWQDYLDELRMLDEGCPNCEPLPQRPTASVQTVRIARPAPPRRRHQARALAKRWLAALAVGTVDVLIKIGVALF